MEMAKEAHLHPTDDPSTVGEGASLSRKNKRQREKLLQKLSPKFWAFNTSTATSLNGYSELAPLLLCVSLLENCRSEWVKNSPAVTALQRGEPPASPFLPPALTQLLLATSASESSGWKRMRPLLSHRRSRRNFGSRQNF